MQPLACGRCGTVVAVSKFSAEQTSIQWRGDSTACPLRAELSPGDTCPALAETIRDAVLEGVLGVSTRDE